MGDPKQSIYRFRRADIDALRRAQKVFARSGRSHLTENFRTVRSVVDFVNALFDAVDGRAPRAIATTYVALTAHVADHDDRPAWTSVTRTPVPAAEIRVHEADAVVRVIAQAKARGRGRCATEKTGELRPRTYRDIAVLMPTRASLPALDHALDEAGIPARVESRIAHLEHGGGPRPARRAERGR